MPRRVTMNICKTTNMKNNWYFKGKGKTWKCLISRYFSPFFFFFKRFKHFPILNSSCWHRGNVSYNENDIKHLASTCSGRETTSHKLCLSAEWRDSHAGDGDAAHLGVVELCLHVQRLQNLVENRVQTEGCRSLALRLHRHRRRVRLDIARKKPERRPKGGREPRWGHAHCQARGLATFLRLPPKLGHGFGDRPSEQPALVARDSPGIWKTCGSRASPRTEWCSWRRRLICKSEAQLDTISLDVKAILTV